MKLFSNRFYALLFFMAFALRGNATNREGEINTDRCVRLQGGYIMGGQIVNDDFIYDPGGSFNAVYSIKTSERLEFGLGSGIEFFEEERFVPFYFDFTGMLKKKKNTAFIVFQSGYALGINNTYESYQNYEFKGGPCFGAAVGRRFHVNEGLSCFILGRYRHQFASVSYQLTGMPEYQINLSYDMLTISFGIMIEQDKKNKL